MKKQYKYPEARIINLIPTEAIAETDVRSDGGEIEFEESFPLDD